MSDDDPQQRESEAKRRARRRRRLDEVFGDVMPDVTSDESANAPSGQGGPSRPSGSDDDRDDEIRRDVPPHHA